MTISVSSPDETAAVAQQLAPRLAPGDILCLHGDLGAGKTTFTRALVAALGSPALVSSPTFTLVQEYEGGRLPVAHIDCYRLFGPDEFTAAGLDDYLLAPWLAVIEWPERIAALLPTARWRVTLEETGPESRRVRIEEPGCAS